MNLLAHAMHLDPGMKKQIKQRKVQVKTETIRKMSEKQLEQTAGGGIPTRVQNTQDGYCFITH